MARDHHEGRRSIGAKHVSQFSVENVAKGHIKETCLVVDECSER